MTKKLDRDIEKMLKKIEETMKDREELYRAGYGIHYDFLEQNLEKYKKNSSTENLLSLADSLGNLSPQSQELLRPPSMPYMLAKEANEGYKLLLEKFKKTPQYVRKRKQIEKFWKGIRKRNIHVTKGTRETLKELWPTKPHTKHLVEHEFNLDAIKKGKDVFLTFRRGGNVAAYPKWEATAPSNLTGIFFHSKAKAHGHTHPRGSEPSFFDGCYVHNLKIPGVVVSPSYAPYGEKLKIWMLLPRKGKVEEFEIRTQTLKKRKRFRRKGKGRR